MSKEPSFILSLLKHIFEKLATLSLFKVPGFLIYFAYLKTVFVRFIDLDKIHVCVAYKEGCCVLAGLLT